MLYEQALKIMDEYVDGKHGGNLSSAARDLGVKMHALRKWKERLSVPNSRDICTILGKAGVKFAMPDAVQTRDICFVDPKIVNTGQNAMPPDAEDYFAVPLVGEAGAGPGMVAEEDLKSWVLVYRNLKSLARRSNFIAVEIGKNQRSMVPLLHPGDIVLVDLDDIGQDGISAPGNIFLVREPGQEGGGKVKRVSLTGKGESEIITFYSENAEAAEPEPYFLHGHYDGDITNAIVGKVVWAWTDLTRK